MGLLVPPFQGPQEPAKNTPSRVILREFVTPFGTANHRMSAPLAKMQKSYFQDSFMQKKELDLQEIPSNARLFICDATSMYTNIKTGPALHHIGQLALENKAHLTVPPAVLMGELHLLMNNNVFQFGDTLWLQKVGTAMGAPPAPPWALS